jgi:cytosine/adenosine deaminase-related metal-dependent hydrolase
VVHCPSCSLQLGYDIPPLADWAAANDRLAVSVDGAASNDRGSMLLESQLAWQAQRARFGGAPNLLSANQALGLTSAGGARAINWPELGGLAVGRPADLAIVDFGSIDYAGIPLGERAKPAELLMKVYAGAPVRDLIVGERIVLRQGKFVSIDLSAVITAANGTAEALHGR